MDDLATFSSLLPSWVDAKGMPLSYRHFCYGMAWIHRHEARTLLRDSAATRLSQADRSDYSRERRHLLRTIGDG